MSKTTAVAISGGIDSLYAAYLLLKSGYNVQGVHFVTGYEPDPLAEQDLPLKTSNKVIHHCECSNAVTASMSLVAEQLGIKIHIIDCHDTFQNTVVDYFINSYQAGKTPSPCLACNPAVKFGALLDFADTLNVDFLATGHYAQIKIDQNGVHHLHKGVDSKKDQSYFLAFLNQTQLKKAKFPLGDKTKAEIIKNAKAANLKPVSSEESQDVCFIKDNDYKEFLLSCPGFSTSPGVIKTSDEKEIGKHSGLHSFTVGQRRGIDCPGPAPYYVLKLDVETNSLIVGFKDELLAKSCKVSGISWINKPESKKMTIRTHIRYRHNGAESLLELTENNTGTVNFDVPVSAITPGQGAVFYSGSEVMGGGWII